MLQSQSKRTRSKRRAYVVGYYACVTLLGMVWGVTLYRDSRLVAVLIPVLYMVSIAMGGVKAGGLVRPFSRFYDTTASTPEFLRTPSCPVDERDLRVRNQAHYTAYSVMRALGLICTLVIVAVVVLDPRRLVALVAFLLYPAYALLMSLPQAVLLWTEPDPEPEPSSNATLAGAMK